MATAVMIAAAQAITVTAMAMATVTMGMETATTVITEMGTMAMATGMAITAPTMAAVITEQAIPTAAASGAMSSRILSLITTAMTKKT